MEDRTELSVPDDSGLLRTAIDKGVDVETIERLVALQERVMDRNAATEFADAMARFQAAVPSVPKTSTAEIVTKSGQRYRYSYAELDEIARAIRDPLAESGLSYTWDSEVVEGMLRCTCTVHHVNGHSSSASFSCPVDTSARMSEPQKYAAALTFARRQSLLQALGLTTTEPDNDAGLQGVETITEQQALDLDVMIGDVGANRDRFLSFMGVSDIEEIRASDYRRAVNALEAKRRQRGAS